MKFSERIGINPPKTIVQIESIDTDLLNSLWNLIELEYIDESATRIKGSKNRKYYNSIWFSFFKLPMDELGGWVKNANKFIRSWFFDAKWFEIYDFIEFISNIDNEQKTNFFVKRCNFVLEREKSGYRFVGKILTRITNTQEINEIESLLSNKSGGLVGVNKHIKVAINKYSDRKEPDYRNSIKESISAVESMVKLITKEQKATLGKALKILEEKIGLHKALINGYTSIYGYTSDADGIRHALMVDSTVDSEDAKYMLVSCSAFINYLIEKSSKAGIDLNT